MNYFCIVNLCSHFPYVATTATSNNSLLIFKILPINTIQIRGHPRVSQVNSLFLLFEAECYPCSLFASSPNYLTILVTNPLVAFAFIVIFFSKDKVSFRFLNSIFISLEELKQILHLKNANAFAFEKVKFTHRVPTVCQTLSKTIVSISIFILTRMNYKFII